MADVTPLYPTGTDTPYCTAARLFVYHDWQQVADMMRDGDAPRPTRADLLDAGTDAGAALLVLGLAASGEVEAACVAGRYYRPEDLSRLAAAAAGATPPDNALTARGRLEKIVADVWFWMVCQRRQPLTGDPTRVPGAQQAQGYLAELRSGARTFGLAAS